MTHNLKHFMNAENNRNEYRDWVSAYGLTPKSTTGAKTHQVADLCWRLEIPAGSGGRYRLAQYDDYSELARDSFPWSPPIAMSLRARASQENIPGTWGFGFWNDPFSLSSGIGGGVRRFPTLPNAAWFFFASEPNYLSLRDDIPATGYLSATFQSRHIYPPLLALGTLALPLFAVPSLGRWFRHLGRRFVKQDATEIPIKTATWHKFEIDWGPERVTFRVDHQIVMQTNISPAAPLGLVIWIDNQYAALTPEGRLRYGTLANTEPAWIEIERVAIFKGIIDE